MPGGAQVDCTVCQLAVAAHCPLLHANTCCCRMLPVEPAGQACVRVTTGALPTHEADGGGGFGFGFGPGSGVGFGSGVGVGAVPTWVTEALELAHFDASSAAQAVSW